MVFKIKVDQDSMLRYAIAVNISYASFSTLIYSFWGNTSVIRNILITLIVVLNIITILKNFNRILPLVKIAIAVLILWMGTYILYPDNRWVLSEMQVDIFKYGILSYFICISDYFSLNSGLKIGAYIIVFCCAFEPMTHYVTIGSNGYMVYGMRLLLAIILLEYYFFVEKKPIHAVTLSLAVVLVLLYGNRSSLLISVICMIISFLMNGENKNRIVRYLMIVVASLLMLIALTSNFLMLFVAHLESIGISSRTLTLFLSGFESAINNNGRSIIWANCRKAIAEKPWTGYGIGGERNLYLLGRRYVSRMGGVYAHNFIYELILNFGVVIGAVVLLIIFYYSIKVIQNRKGWENRNLYLLLIIATIIKLFFSSSIWVDIHSYICLGLVMNYCRSQKDDFRQYSDELVLINE